ncbi:GntR family transcriptional regulator [Nocardioides rotundus]|uniref:GntR family transcriptional regulator n=2 Tax=Bacteria TaxID=2 RepID=UPI001CC161C5|nr:GntR family transcriptional regulator [Nocardioides rotundus]UAL31425.1 GntR family transcriptional regulator [Nocardioides rotundus]
MVARDDDMPFHAVVRTELLEQIRTGKLRPHDQVPTEPELMERYGVSRTTVRRALRDLETQGFVTREPGRGTFVREPHVKPRLDRLTGFVEDMDALGLEASATVELVERTRAGSEVATQLGLRRGEEVVHIERVRLGNEVPISFDESWFPTDVGDRVAQENLAEDPFYAILEDKYDIALAGADFVVRATSADDRIAGHLQIEPGRPVLRLTRLSRRKPDGRPLIFEFLHYAGDRISYRLTLDR